MSDISVDVEKQPLNTNSEVSDSKKLEFTSWKILDKIYKCIQIMFVLASINSLSIMFSGIFDSEDKSYLMIDPSISYGICDDYKFGCCKIFDSCKVENDTFTSTELYIDPKIIHRHNSFGDNCPRLVDMVEDYRLNHYQYNEGKIGDLTCKIDLTCDYRAYFGEKLHESNNHIVNAYFSNMRKGGIQGDTGYPKKYGKCLSIHQIIQEYEHLNRGLNRKEYYYICLSIISTLTIVLYLCFKVINK